MVIRFSRGKIGWRRRPEVGVGQADVEAQVVEFVASEQVLFLIIRIGEKGQRDEVFSVDVNLQHSIGPIAAFASVGKRAFKDQRGSFVKGLFAEEAK